MKVISPNFLFLTADTPSLSQSSYCNRNGGSLMTFEGSCSSRNYTYTSQCNVEDKNGECHVSANSCGCQVIYPEGGKSSIGSGSKGCANACVDIIGEGETVPGPDERTCMASGSGVSWTGSCDSRNYTFTPQCSFAETLNDQQNPVECMVTERSCGCLYWEKDSEYVSGLSGKNCDACHVHGYPPVPSGANSVGNGLLSVYVASFVVGSVAWMTL